jgi:hypothetical protein
LEHDARTVRARKYSRALRALMRRRDPSAGSAAGPSIVRAAYGKPKTPPGSSETNGKNLFQEIDKHLLIVSDVVAALVDGGTCRKARLARLAFPLPTEITIPNRNERWAACQQYCPPRRSNRHHLLRCRLRHCDRDLLPGSITLRLCKSRHPKDGHRLDKRTFRPFAPGPAVAKRTMPLNLGSRAISFLEAC